jgi:two-component system, NarL family, response regulator NreC
MSIVLIVDDHAAVRLAVRELFESCLESITCGEAENGAEAILKTRELKPDLVVLDLSMPVVDGFETAKALRQLFPAIPVVMLTAHYMETTKQAAQQAGIRAVFSKQEDLSPLIAHARAVFATR